MAAHEARQNLGIGLALLKWTYCTNLVTAESGGWLQFAIGGLADYQKSNEEAKGRI